MPTSTDQTIINSAIGFIAVMAAWLWRVMWNTGITNTKSLAEFKTDVAKDCVDKERYQKDIEALQASITSNAKKVDKSLSRIYDKLDNKADK